MTQSGGFARLLLEVMDWNKTCFLSNFVVGYLNCIPVKLSFRYQVIKSYSVFCFHHGPGPSARQLCKVVMPAFD